MIRTFSTTGMAFSVDMMIAYVNIFKPKVHNLDAGVLYKNLYHECWGDPKAKIKYSPMDMIGDMKNKKYMEDKTRVIKTKTKYPIIVWDGFVIDGVHRLTKAYLHKKKKIKAYVFSDKLMEKFIISKSKTWYDTDCVEPYNTIKLFYERFCSKAE